MATDIEIIKRETADLYEYANGITDEMMIWRMREQDRMVLRDYMDDIRATARAIEMAADRLAGGKR